MSYGEHFQGFESGNVVLKGFERKVQSHYEFGEDCKSGLSILSPIRNAVSNDLTASKIFEGEWSTCHTHCHCRHSYFRSCLRFHAIICIESRRRLGAAAMITIHSREGEVRLYITVLYFQNWVMKSMSNNR